jgi:hypothetical protein
MLQLRVSLVSTGEATEEENEMTEKELDEQES